MFLRTNEESSHTSPARSAHHPPTSIRFARSVRKNRGLFRESPLVLPKISLLSDVSRPLFPPFPPHTPDSGAFPPTPTRIRKQLSQFPCTLPRLAESNCQFVSRRPRVGADFRGAFTTLLATQRQKTTTSKHILAEYIRRDTYFLSFLSLTDKKVVHLQRIDK